MATEPKVPTRRAPANRLLGLCVALGVTLLFPLDKQVLRESSNEAHLGSVLFFFFFFPFLEASISVDHIAC